MARHMKREKNGIRRVDEWRYTSRECRVMRDFVDEYKSGNEIVWKTRQTDNSRYHEKKCSRKKRRR